MLWCAPVNAESREGPLTVSLSAYVAPPVQPTCSLFLCAAYVQPIPMCSPFLRAAHSYTGGRLAQEPLGVHLPPSLLEALSRLAAAMEVGMPDSKVVLGRHAALPLLYGDFVHAGARGAAVHGRDE